MATTATIDHWLVIEDAAPVNGTGVSEGDEVGRAPVERTTTGVLTPAMDEDSTTPPGRETAEETPATGAVAAGAPGAEIAPEMEERVAEADPTGTIGAVTLIGRLVAAVV